MVNNSDKNGYKGYGYGSIFGKRSKEDIELGNKICEAAKNGDIKQVKYLIEECKADPNIKNNYGETPLFIASEKGDLDI